MFYFETYFLPFLLIFMYILPSFQDKRETIYVTEWQVHVNNEYLATQYQYFRIYFQ